MLFWDVGKTVYGSIGSGLNLKFYYYNMNLQVSTAGSYLNLPPMKRSTIEPLLNKTVKNLYGESLTIVDCGKGKYIRVKEQRILYPAGELFIKGNSLLDILFPRK
jgi:hypothetical protein